MILVVVGALGTISNHFNEWIEKIRIRFVKSRAHASRRPKKLQEY